MRSAMTHGPFIKRISSTLAGALAALLVAPGARAAECGALPVKAAEQATCLARGFLVANQAPQWDVAFEPLDRGKRWHVRYAAKSPNVRGGSGELSVEKDSGKVTLVWGYR